MSASAPFDILFFDLGNTLIYFDSVWSEVLVQAVDSLVDILHENKYPVDRERFGESFRQKIFEYHLERDNNLMERSMEYILRSALLSYGVRKPSPMLIRQALARMYSVLQAHWHIEADTHPTLKILAEQGYRMGIISNASDSQDVQTLIDKAELRHYFEIIIISSDVGIRKPHEKIFQIALEKTGTQASRAMMIGDTLNADILGALNAGLVSAWIERRAQTPANLLHRELITPDVTISSLGELPPLLEAWEIP